MTPADPDKETASTAAPDDNKGQPASEPEVAADVDKDIPPVKTVAPPAPVRRGGGRGLSVLALLLALVACGAAGYLFYQVELVQKLERGAQTAAFNRQVDQLGASLKNLQAADTVLQQGQRTLEQNVNEKISARLEQFAKDQQALTESLKKVYAQLNRNLDSWALEEVEQLLRIANHSLVLNRDVPTALAGLELADKRLRNLGDPNLLPVRQQIAKDVTLIKAVPEVDISGLTLRLGSMRSAVDKLPLVSEPQRDLAGASQNKAANAAKGWLASSKELLTDTLGVIRIQNITKPVRPLLTPEQRYFLLSNLRLMLAGAQLAALQLDQMTYRDNLSQAQQWLREYFDTGDGRVEKTIAELDKMQHIDLAPTLPDIAGSITALTTAKQKMTIRE